MSGTAGGGTTGSAGPVAIVGVGNMGGAMAQRLLSCGWPVRVADIDPAKVASLVRKGASAPATPSALAIDCIAIVVCVVDAQQVQEVLAGLLPALRPGQAVLMCPTIAPGDAEAFSAQLAAQGVDMLDAPMSGGPVRAREGTMSLMVAGPRPAFARLQPLLDTLASRVFDIGARAGDGARTKLVNNLLAGINLVGAAEALALAGRLGLDLSATLEVIEESSGQSWIGSDRMRRALAGDWEPRAHVHLLRKDTRLAVEAGQAAGFEGPLGPVARDVFEQAAQAGLGGLDDAAVFRLLAEQRA
jgi:3-hydroxyisobutyrate dehydrogenase